MLHFRLKEYVKWRYTYGKDYEFFLKLERDNIHTVGWETPKALSSMPEIDDILDTPYIEAFYLLDGSRQMGMGLGPIPLSEIANLWNIINLGELEDFVTIIQQADFYYLQVYNDDPKNKPKK